MNRALKVVFASSFAAVLASSASAAVIVGDTADAVARNNYGTPSVVGLADQTAVAADYEYGGERRVYTSVFQIPDLGAAANPFTAATASFTLISASGTSWVHLDLGALAARSSANVLSSDGFGSSIGLTLSTSDTAGVKSTSGTALVTFLNQQYASGANANKYVFLTFSPTDYGSADWTFATADNATVANRPVISYTAVVPEPAALALVGLSAGSLLTLRRRRA